MRILIVDDNEQIIETLVPGFLREKYEVLTANDGEKAIELFYDNKIDLILLDIMMPNMSGLEVFEELRGNSNVPIMFMTAKADEEDIVKGLNMGSDDYVTKPFSPKQVIARVKAVLRRTIGDEILELDNLYVNKEDYIVKVDNNTVNLSKKELDLLYILMSKPNRVFTREFLLEALWDIEYEGELRNVDNYIKRIRKKLDCKKNNSKWSIKTVWGVGYKFDVKED